MKSSPTRPNDSPEDSADTWEDPDIVPEQDETEAPEVPRGAENLTVWDEAAPADIPHGTGNLVEDEAVAPERLVEEGMEEADRELRLSAADEPDDEDLSDDAEAGSDYPTSGILS